MTSTTKKKHFAFGKLEEKEREIFGSEEELSPTFLFLTLFFLSGAARATLASTSLLLLEKGR